MVLYKSKDLTVGAKVEINGEPHLILENIFINPGRYQAFNKLKLKNMINNSIISKTVKIGEKLKQADIDLKDLKYLYKSDEFFYFYDEKNFEYHELSANSVNECKKWLKEGIVYSVIFWNNEAIEVKPNKFIELKIISSEIFDKKSCVSKNFKYAKLETGIDIKVPPFIKDNDIIKIDTEKELYISRITSHV